MKIIVAILDGANGLVSVKASHGQKLFKETLIDINYLVHNNLLSIWHPICHKPWLSQMGQGYPDLEWFDHCIREKDTMHFYPVSTGKVWRPKIHGLSQETINLV